MSSLREKANQAKKLRCKTLTCVLENPKNINNVGAVIRNIDALGIGKLFIVDGYNIMESIPPPGGERKKKRKVASSSMGAWKWVYIKVFKTSEECFEHLRKHHYQSICTSPHVKSVKNTFLYDGDYTFHHLAVWFGNESEGISDYVVSECEQGCVQIEMSGIAESLNLSCATSIVLWHIAQKRREWYRIKKGLD